MYNVPGFAKATPRRAMDKSDRMRLCNRVPRGYGWKLALCVALSLVLHGSLALLLLMLPKREKTAVAHRLAHRARAVQVLRHVPSPASRPNEENKRKEQKQTERDFAKTSADARQARPDRADYEGAHNSRATSDPTARDRRSEEEAPAVHGRERLKDEEIVTFDQERQEDELSAEGKKASSPAQPTPPAPTMADEQAPDFPPPAAGTPEGSAAGTATAPAPHKAATAPSLTLTPDPFGELPTAERHKDDDSAPADTASAPQGQPHASGEVPTNTPAQRAARRYYDPALSEEAQQPGFRTAERKTRSSGRFIFGKGAALNVEATPRGQYEADIYRRVAHQWYIACDDHRGDIIPGRITISLRINRQGRLINMSLIHRRGASVSQQSFTFAAIRRAALPPMPDAVKQDIVGELLELIFTFHFD